MADIKFTAFVNSALTSSVDDTVWLLKTAESHRREDEDGNWETTARTFRDVRLSKEAAKSIDLAAFAEEGTRIVVEGFEVTVPSERDGVTYYNLTVYASSVELAESHEQGGSPVRKGGKPAAKAPARGNRR